MNVPIRNDDEIVYRRCTIKYYSVEITVRPKQLATVPYSNPAVLSLVSSHHPVYMEDGETRPIVRLLCSRTEANWYGTKVGVVSSMIHGEGCNLDRSTFSTSSMHVQTKVK